MLAALSGLVLVPAAGGWAAPGSPRAVTTHCKSAAWRQYGATAQHTFAVASGCSPITASNVATLLPKWFFHAPDSVSASPAVVGNSVYVGDWAGHFYSINARTGAKQWEYTIALPDPVAFGQIVSSAAVEPFLDRRTGTDREVVIFGGGSIVWALDASTGKLLAKLDIDPRKPALRKKQRAAGNAPVVEIEASPAVADVRVGRHTQRRIYVGMDVHNDAGVGRTGVVAMRLRSSVRGKWSLQPVWKNDPETDHTYYGRAGLTAGSGQGQGCGDVWSSPAVEPAANLVIYGVGNCDHPPTAKKHQKNWSESITAVRADNGKFKWRYAPSAHHGSVSNDIAAAYQDDDFGASVNIYRTANGRLVAGDGSKGSVYYARAARSGKALWHTQSGQPGNLQQDFAVGGFIGSLAVGASSNGRAGEIVGGTAIPLPKASVQSLDNATEDIHAFNPQTGRVDWTTHLAAPTYASASVANDVVFMPVTTCSCLLALNLKTGAPLWVNPAIGPPSSTAVVSGSSVYLGTGTNESDLEYKGLGLAVPAGVQRAVGQSPLSPLSGVQAWQLASSAL
jgi:polyvinyl alcohol dehydrogenase (cytochrome)